MESCGSLLGSMIANVTDGILRLAIKRAACPWGTPRRQRPISASGPAPSLGPSAAFERPPLNGASDRRVLGESTNPRGQNGPGSGPGPELRMGLKLPMVKLGSPRRYPLAVLSYSVGRPVVASMGTLSRNSGTTSPRFVG